ncbi:MULTISPECIES: flagellar motor protein MotB [unclassified Bradyrhizobium]|uniref:OmpA/MotB family protein n=1 Tax=Bradyrhizobium TaxID=374 RepID=UPI0028ED4260|nr:MULTISPECIES: OmpA family protein [unclassified Bradyrhizobium]
MALEQDAGASEFNQGENYFVSMTDMMVGMLFIFIILLMSFALAFRQQTDTQEVKTQEQQDKIEVAKEVGRKLDELETRISRRMHEIQEASQLRSRLLTELQIQLRREGLAVEVVDSSGVLRLTEEAVLFRSNDTTLFGQAKTNVDKIARVLGRILPPYAACLMTQSGPSCPKKSAPSLETVFVEGHTDSTGPDDSNWTFSTYRAANTYRELMAASPDLRQMLNRAQEEIFSVAGYSSTRPVDSAANDIARKKNRRIDLRFVMDTDPSPGLQDMRALLLSMRTTIQELRGSPP